MSRENHDSAMVRSDMTHKGVGGGDGFVHRTWLASVCGI